MFRSKDAQATFEYAAIVILVIVGILVMGPYVIRSINAYFKFTEDTVRDSYLEEIKQGDPIDGEWRECVCTSTIIKCDDTRCLPYQHAEKLLCTPIGCRESFVCVDAWDECCDFEFIGLCGSESLSVVDFACPDGQGLFQRVCQTTPYEDYECRAHYSCQYSCVGAPPEVRDGTNLTRWAWCPGAASGLTDGSIVVTYVDRTNCAGAKCEIECRSNYHADPLGCLCPVDGTLGLNGWADEYGIGNKRKLYDPTSSGVDCVDNPELCCPQGYSPGVCASGCTIDIQTMTIVAGVCL